MTPSEHIQAFDRALARCPLVAILRGVAPDEAPAMGRALVSEGIEIIEVPLNSPDPLVSIGRLAAELGNAAVVGAGTVLDPASVDAVADAGGSIIVSPNMDPAVIRQTVARGLVSLPGIFTPTEAFAALQAGAHALKLFPAEAAAPKVVSALRAVLPQGTRLLIVGGVDADTLKPWQAAGAAGFGLGSWLYKPGRSPSEVASRARDLVAAWRAVQGGG